MEKNIQITFAIIKPDAIDHAVEIIDILYKNGFTMEQYEVKKLDSEILRVHYSHVADRPFYPSLEEFMTSGNVVLMVLQGDNAVSRLRELMGPTDSTLAAANTIRGMYGTDKTKNAIHGSDSIENAEIEIKRFFSSKVKVKTVN